MKWDEETTKKNFEAAQEAKKKTPEESVTFASKFKNAAEDTATDIDTVTDNFQSDMHEAVILWDRNDRGYSYAW